MSEVFNDLLKIPDVAERQRMLTDNPQVRNLVEQALASDGSYNAADENGKAEIREMLGFPRPTPGATQLSWSPNFATSPTAEPVPTSGQMLPAGQKFTVPTRREWAGQQANVMRERGTAAQLLDPTDPQNLGAILKGFYEKQLGAPMTREFHADDSMASQFARGVVSSVPGLSAVTTPKGAPDPSFLSIENAAKLATDLVMTAPIFTAAATLGAPMMTAFGAMKFFMTFPGIARMVTEATMVGLADAPYRAFVRGTTQLIQDGKITPSDLSKHFAPDFAGAFLGTIGFTGVLRAPSAIAQAAQRRYGMSQGVADQAVSGGMRAVGRDLSQGTPAGLTKPLIPRSASDFAHPRENIVSEMRGVEPEVPPFSERPTMYPPFRPGSPEAIAMPERTVVDTWRNPFTMNPAENAAWKDLKSEHKIDLKSDGSFDISIAEPVLKTMFQAPEKASAGDFVYWRSRQDKSMTGRVLSAFEDGVMVDTGAGQSFVKFEKLSVSKRPFALNDSVYTTMGEELVVKGYSPMGLVHVQDAKGNMRLEPVDRLRSYETNLTTQKTAEAAVKGIDTPQPEGMSVFDLFVEEKGSMFPGGRWRKQRSTDVEDITHGRAIPLGSALQPDSRDFGVYRYVLDPINTLNQLNRPEYTMLANALMQNKGVSAQLEAQMTGTIKNYRKMIGGGSDARGANIETSAKLARFALGVPKPGESLTSVERSVIDTFRDWASRDMIPVINAKRVALKQQPVPPDYPWAFQLFPDLVMNRGYHGGGLGEAFAKSMKILGTDNAVEIEGKAARINVQANFWDLALEAMRYVNHEKAWRPTIEAIKQQASVDPSSTNKVYLRWLADHLDGRRVAPDVSDLAAFTYRMDEMLPKLKGTSIDILEDIQLNLGKGQTGTIAAGRKSFGSPIFSIAEQNLADLGMASKNLNYGNSIAFNLRTVALNAGQTWTHLLPVLPGNPIQNAFNILEGQARSLYPIFSKKAQKYYRDIGVLHDSEEIFSAQNITSMTGDLPHNINYVKDWFFNTYRALQFYGMRSIEISNRTAGHFAARKGLLREVQNKGFAQSLNDPAFMQAIEQSSVNMTNIANFLYGKGFKSPIQADLGLGLDSNANSRIRSMFAPLGEFLYHYNSFGTKTIGMIMNMAAQSARMRDAAPASLRMAALNGPQEFGDFLKTLQPQARYAVLRYFAFGTAASMYLGAGLGLGGFAWQMSPLSILPNPYTPVIKAFAKAGERLGGFDPWGAIKAVGSAHIPAPLPGSVPYQRWQRGGTLADRTLKTREEMEGRTSPYATFGKFFGGSEQARGR